MPTLEELLRASLKGANEKYDQANKSLHAAVAEAAKAVETVTGGKAFLRLHQVEQAVDWTRYRLVVASKSGKEVRSLTILEVPLNGFPIERLEDDRHTENLTILEKFDTSEQLHKYFRTLVSDPNSPLVAYLAYILRNTPEGGGDPIPS